MAPPIVETTLIGATEATKVTALNPSLFQSGLFAKVIVGIIVSLFVTIASIATVGVVVWRTNYRAPGPVNDYFETWKNTPIEMAVLRNDKAEAGGAPGDEGDRNTLRLVSLSVPLHGIAEILATNKHVQYTPDFRFAGVDTFSYVVSNGKKEATGNVTVKVKNNAPEPKDDIFGQPIALQKNVEYDLDVLVNDEDQDQGDVLTIVSCTGIFENDMGTPSVNPDGLSIHWKPKQQYVGTGSFQYTVTDGNDTASATVYITVANSPPVAETDKFTIVRNTPTQLDVLLNDHDPNGDALAILEASSPDSGKVNVAAEFVTYTPNFNYVGGDIFDYTIWDKTLDDQGKMFTSTARVDVEVASPAPFANDDSVSVSKNTGAQNILADGVAGTVIPYTYFMMGIATEPQHGTASVVLSNSEVIQFEYLGEQRNYTSHSYQIMYAPVHGYVGNDEIKYNITDEFGATSVGTISIRVVNDPPVPVDDDAEVARNSRNGIVIDVLANDSDPNGDDLRLNTAFTLSPAHGHAVVVDDRIVYTPNAGYFGADSFEYSVSDISPDSQSSIGTVRITVRNDAPQPQDDFMQVPKNVAKDLAVLANDIDPNQDILTIVSVADDSNSVIKGTKQIIQSNPQVIRYTPVAGQNYEERFQYTVSDGDASKHRSAWVYVNITNTPPVTVDEYTTAHWKDLFEWDLVANDYDENGDMISLSMVDILVETGSRSTVEQLDTRNVRVTVDHTNYMFTATQVTSTQLEQTAQKRSSLAAEVVAQDRVIYKVTDGHDVGTRIGTLRIDVMNNIPVAVDDEVTVHVNRPTEIDTATLLANDYDNDEQDTISIDSAQIHFDYEATGATAELSPDQKTITFTAKEKGEHKILYTLTDGCFHTSSVIGIVTVNVINTPPVAVDDFYYVSAQQIPTPHELVITLNDYDPDAISSSVRPKIVHGSLPSGTTSLGGSVTIGTDDYRVNYTPPPTVQGNDTFTYRVSDGYDESNLATVTIQLVAGEPPQAVVDIIYIHWRSDEITKDVSANDIPGDLPELHLVSVTPGTYTSVARISGDGKQIVYKPNAAAVVLGQPDIVPYTTSDGIYTASSQMNVFFTNQLPVCLADTASAVHWRSPSSSVNALLNDQDPDNDDISVQSIGTSQFGRGVATLNADKATVSFTFSTSTIEFAFGELEGNKRVVRDTVPYTLFDSKQTATENCKVEFSVYDSAPVAVDDLFQAAKNAENVVLSVLDNDSDPDAADGPHLRVFNAVPITGIASIVSFNPLTVHLVKGFAGTAQLRYNITDGKLRSESAIVSIEVVNNPPMCSQPKFTLPKTDGHQGKVSTFDLIALACTDADGDALELTTVGTSAIGTTGIASNKATFVPTDNMSGESVVSFTVTDKQANTGSTFKVTITNHAPIARDITDSFDRSSYVSKDYPLVVTDVDNDPITITGIAPVPGFGGQQDGPNRVVFGDRCTVDFIAPSILRYTQSQSGRFPVVYTATDNDLANPLTDSATVDITVNGLPPIARPDSYVLDQGGSMDFYVMDNDEDPDGDGIEMDVNDWLAVPPTVGPTPVLLTDNFGKQFIRYDATSFPDFCKSLTFTYKIKSIDGDATAVVSVKFTNCVCKVPLDVVYCVDSSGSIGRGTFDNRVRPFLIDVTTQLDIGAGATQIRTGIVQFGYSAYVESDGLLTIKDGTKKNPGVKYVVNNMSYKSSWTNTKAGLVASDSMLVGKNSRSGVNKLIIVLTDGEYTHGGNPQSTAQSIYNRDGWRIIAIAVGNFDTSLIKQLVKNPAEDYFEVEDFNALQTVLQGVVTAACDSV